MALDDDAPDAYEHDPHYDIPLAWNIEGDRATMPDDAAGWRVRAAKIGPGRPAAVYGADGLPLWLPLDADVSALARAVDGEPGRYRLDWLNAHHRIIHGASPCFVFVRDTAAKPSSERAASGDYRDQLISSQLRAIQELAATVAENNAALVSQIGSMLSASATVVQAADGAGIAHRAPLAPPAAQTALALVHDDEDDDISPRTAAVLAEARALLAPLLADYLASRRAKSDQTALAPVQDPARAETQPERNATPGATQRASEPNAAEAFLAEPRVREILAKLDPTERDAARAMAHRLPADKLPALLSYLLRQPLSLAVDMVRRYAATAEQAATAALAAETTSA